MTAPSLRTGPAAGRKCRGRWLAAPVPKGVGANPTALVQWGLTVSFTSGAEEAAVADIRRAFSLARRWQNPRSPHANPLWLGQ